jgi:hypothetical protein
VKTKPVGSAGDEDESFPTEVLTPAVTVRPSRRSAFRVTAVGTFGAAFLLLVAAAVAVLLAQVKADSLAPWLSLGFSAGAVAFTVTALVLARRR